MSNSVPPPDSAFPSSPLSVYRPFSHLPSELVQTIIDSSIPPRYDSTTYSERQETLRSLCLVSRLFRRIAQKCLCVTAVLEARDQMLEWQTSFSTGVPGATTKVDLIFLRSGLVDGDIQKILLDHTGLRLLAVWELTVTFDLSLLSALPHLRILRLCQITLSKTSFVQPSKIEELQLLRVGNSDLALDPVDFPSLRSLAYSTQGGPTPLVTIQALCDIASQLETISLDLDVVSQLPAQGVRALNPFTLFDVLDDMTDLLNVQHARVLDPPNYEVLEDLLEQLSTALNRQDSHVPLRLVYLPTPFYRYRVSSKRIDRELALVEAACQAKKVEIVWEDQPGSWMSDSGISQDFWRRTKQAGEGEF